MKKKENVIKKWGKNNVLTFTSTSELGHPTKKRRKRKKRKQKKAEGVRLTTPIVTIEPNLKDEHIYKW